MKKVIFFSIVSWVIVGFGQPAWLPWLAPLSASLGYALFWKGIEKQSRRFWLGMGWFACVQAIQLSWMTSIEFQGWYIVGVYLALCWGLGAQFGVLTLIIPRIPLVASAALWTLFEWGRLYLFCGFSWNPIGLSLTAYTFPLQFAALLGIFFLSFWVMLTNLALFHNKVKAWLFLALVPYCFGALHVSYHAGRLEKSPTLSVALVQTSFLPSEKRKIAPLDQWSQLLSLFPKGKGIDLVVFPENVLPSIADAPNYQSKTVQRMLQHTFENVPSFDSPTVSNLSWMQMISRSLSADVVAGLEAREGELYYAAAFHCTPTLAPPSRYEKQLLVPLAEYLPFTWLKRWTKEYGITSFFTPGKEGKVFAGKVPLSLSICYEETFSHLMREGRKKGAELFVNLTNDGWYPSSHLPQEHFSHGKVRTVENGIPLVRSCNLGITAAVDSLGRTVASSSIFEREKASLIITSLPTYHYPTLYSLVGDWGIVLLSLLLIASTAFYMWRTR